MREPHWGVQVKVLGLCKGICVFIPKCFNQLTRALEMLSCQQPDKN